MTEPDIVYVQVVISEKSAARLNFIVTDIRVKHNEGTEWSKNAKGSDY